MNKHIRLLILLAILCFVNFEQTAHADCVTDNMGTVYCSKYAGGGAKENNMSQIVCGPGQCLKTNMDEFVCSAVEGGGIGVDSMGTIRGLGGTVRASASMCVRGE